MMSYLEVDNLKVYFKAQGGARKLRAVDGISLTLVNVEADRFSVALIPHTLDVTTLGDRAVGQRVNIEQDILGKYVAKLMSREGGISPWDFVNGNTDQKRNGI